MIKVFVIDDSAMVRHGFRKLLEGSSDITLIGEAENPVDAFEVFKSSGLPDLFILDIEMPKMDGLTFLKKINEQRPTPVIICSTLTAAGSPAAIDAMRLGAVDVIEKPRLNLSDFFHDYQSEFLEKIRMGVMANARLSARQSIQAPKEKQPITTTPATKIVAIGSSTGGVQALEEIISHLAPNHPGIVITQHMPQGFTKSFADRLNQLAPNSIVSEATHDEVVENGKILIAPGGFHMEVYSIGGIFKVLIKDYPKVNSHKPSVNVLFKSIAKCAGKNATGYILTGMGSDGAQGLKMMRDAGAHTYGESATTAIVYGMPRIANEMGAVEKELLLNEIASSINSIT
ncbi:protein-glutamate methylesterase/protein-glutamine glutaminase [Sulfuricurvum sp.]|uniref:protein-glutamate methylesterase/protein-glutamine glutaminase n=1 Tax=Sulfuricurvum sp. TaxID=2025608 RepID=UPI003BB5A1FA